MNSKHHEDIGDFKIFSGTSTLPLTHQVTKLLGKCPGKIEIEKFSDGETRLEVNEIVRGRSIYFIQSTCPPVNDNIMEIFIAADAFFRSGAEKIVAVIPYYGYARQDRRPGYSRTPITSSMIAKLLEASGVTHVITVDLHSGQQQGFFQIPVVNLSAGPLMVADIYRNGGSHNTKIVSPDAGGVVRARAVAKHVDDADLAIIDKRRGAPNHTKAMNVIGDVSGCNCAIIDDMIDTAGTLCESAKALKEKGAKKIVAYATHGVFSGSAFVQIENSEIDEVVVTDTIPLPEDRPSCIRTLSITSIIAETIERIETNKSISEIYAGE